MSSSEETPEEREKRLYKEKLQSLTWKGAAGNGRFVHRPKPNMSWEKGITGESRPDGTFMPYLDANLNPITTKGYADRRGQYDKALSELRATPPSE